MKLSTPLLAVACLSTSLSAFAIPGSLAIDFRSSAWSGAAGQHSQTVGGTTASAFQTPLFSSQQDANLNWTANQGLGVDSRILAEDPRETGPREQLDLSFTGYNLTGAWVTKLFRELVTDSGYVELYDASGLLKTVSFSGQQFAWQNALGDVYVDFGGAYALTGAKFFGESLGRDYTLAGFTGGPLARPTPDTGTTAGLLVPGLLAMGWLARRVNAVRA